MYTIIDVETTGRTNKITEISIFKYNGLEVVDEFTTFINPNTQIPLHITALTGIDNEMVEDAPTFADVADQILDITKDSIFVAHNVNFDYNVILNEFKSIGIPFKRKKLCTVRLSRKLLKGHRSYGLGKLCKDLNILIKDRHRARGDAEATVELFSLLLKKDKDGEVFSSFLNKTSKEAILPSHLPTQVFNAIPHSAGIYFFKDKKGKILYVGKAKDLKKRVISHFYSKTKKSLNMCRETRHIDFELSGNELIALLMEDAAIKKHFPKYNSQSKRNPKQYGIFSYLDRSGIQRFAYSPVKSVLKPFQVFHSIRECRAQLEALCISFNLCPKYCHIQENVEDCRNSYLQTCKGICVEKESVEKYNRRVTAAIDFITSSLDEKIIKQPGRHQDELSFVLIKNGTYQGFGFVEQTEQINTTEELENFILPQKDNIDVQRILRPYL